MKKLTDKEIKRANTLLNLLKKRNSTFGGFDSEFIVLVLLAAILYKLDLVIPAYIITVLIVLIWINCGIQDNGWKLLIKIEKELEEIGGSE